MQCVVCQNTSLAVVCPVCGFDASSPEAKSPRAVERAREEFRARSLIQRVEISTWERWRPWVAVVLGFLLFATWMKACSSPGWPLWQ